MLQTLDLACDRQCVIDSLPVPVVQFYLVPGSTGDWRAYGATFGKVPSKKQTIFGYKLHLLITIGGLILDFVLAPANATDLEVVIELLSEHTDLDVLGDKGYLSAEKATKLLEKNRFADVTDLKPTPPSVHLPGLMAGTTPMIKRIGRGKPFPGQFEYL